MARSVSCLAIGIDALEETLVRRLLKSGMLPNLASLQRAGRTTRLQSPAVYGSGCVWPTFISGLSPESHGVYSEWLWRPDGMTIEAYDPSRLRPFWAGLEKKGISVGVLDVPLAPRLGVRDGFEVSEWGAHDIIYGDTYASPASIHVKIGEIGPHPFGNSPPKSSGPGDIDGLRRIAET
ncbi:MAG: alkaline phosphatase family protein, partial [Acidimicrobiia bacterium]